MLEINLPLCQQKTEISIYQQTINQQKEAEWNEKS
jgi:hypothetical protein